MSRASWAALLASTCLLAMFLGIAISYFIMARYVAHADAQWCDTLRLLTAHPVPKPANPAANPSRFEAWQYYIDFLSLRNRFGC